MAAKWNFMVYMAGFNNLSTFADKDLAEMRKVGSTDDVKLTAFVKRLGGVPAVHMVVGKDGQDEITEDLHDGVDSGNPQTMLDFVRWAVDKAPAERYALVVWNHGSGFDVLEIDELYSQVRGGQGDGIPNVSPREIGLRGTQELGRSVFSTTVLNVLTRPTAGERAIASDDGTGHSLDTIELKNVVEAIHEKVIGQPLDVLGMDACLMSNLEVAYEVQDHATVIVGSEELEPGDGWPYSEILEDLNANPDMTGEELGERIVNRYVDSYQDAKDQWPVTLCATTTAGVAGFVGELDGLAAALRSHLQSDGAGDVQKAQMRSSYFTGELVDIRTLCRELQTAIPNGDVNAAAGKVLDSLGANGYVVNEGHLGDSVTDCGGVTVYFPAPRPGRGQADLGISPYYKDLQFAADNHWDEFIYDYAVSVRG